MPDVEALGIELGLNTDIKNSGEPGFYYACLHNETVVV